MEKEIEILKEGGIGVFPTDTMYGLLGSALRSQTVERIYKVRRRNSSKPLIVLIGQIEDIQQFGIDLNTLPEKIKTLWPGPFSILFSVTSPESEYLHRGTHEIAFRLPDDKELRELLKKTGPLVAPSANFEGDPPAQTIEEARSCFGDIVDFYIDGGKRIAEPSTLVRIEDGKVKVLRQGRGKIEGYSS